LSPIINAKEQRKFAVVDTSDALTQTKTEILKSHHKKVVMKVKGALADTLMEIDHETCGPWLTKEN